MTSNNVSMKRTPSFNAEEFKKRRKTFIEGFDYDI
jgi:hypothetical protein